MAREKEVYELMQQLVIVNDIIVGEVMAAKGYWAAGQSARVQAAKALKNLSEEGRLERRDGFYRVPGCKSEWGEHAQFLTKILAEILKKHTAEIFRETMVYDVGLRADAICMITKDNLGMVLVIEAMNHESTESIKNKETIWNTWPEATGYLSKLFGYRIPHFEFLAIGDGEWEKLSRLLS